MRTAVPDHARKTARRSQRLQAGKADQGNATAGPETMPRDWISHSAEQAHQESFADGSCPDAAKGMHILSCIEGAYDANSRA